MAPSITMTDCPTCGCGGTGEYIVADVEWGICAIPRDFRQGMEMARLCNYIDFKKADSATILLPSDPGIPGVFSESASPLGLYIDTIGVNHRLRITSTPTAPSSCTPESVLFIKSHQIPSGYCYSSGSPPTWNYTEAWITVSSYYESYLYSAPYSSCNSTTWNLNYVESGDRVNVPSVSGNSVFIYVYFGTGTSTSITGWMACGETQYNDRNYCNVPAGTPSPLPSGTDCAGCTRYGTAHWFQADLSFYIKGTLTYYNV